MRFMQLPQELFKMCTIPNQGQQRVWPIIYLARLRPRGHTSPLASPRYLSPLSPLLNAAQRPLTITTRLDGFSC